MLHNDKCQGEKQRTEMESYRTWPCRQVCSFSYEVRNSEKTYGKRFKRKEGANLVNIWRKSILERKQ